MATRTLLTADEFFRLPDGPEASELVRGELRTMSYAGGRHGLIVGRLYRLLIDHVEAHGLGIAFGDGVGYRLPIPGEETDTVRVPDASFVRAGRLPNDEVPVTFIPLAPDLAVEVLSPDQTAAQLVERMDDYFAAGTRLMWVVDPDRRTVALYSPTAPTRWLREHDTLDGGDVVPGFAVAVAALFAGLARRA
jgi:Uma2 family endonuclease